MTLVPRIRTGDPRGFVVRSSVKVPVFDNHLKKAGNIVEITIKGEELS